MTGHHDMMMWNIKIQGKVTNTADTQRGACLEHRLHIRPGPLRS